jgi:peptidoglycan LD-endopeptidase LytH
MDKHVRLSNYIKSNPGAVGKVIDVNAPSDRLFHFNFTSENVCLDPGIFSDTPKFTCWINETLEANNCRYGVGGYMEHRTIYARSPLFDADEEPRRLHLGVDLWGEAGMPVYSPLDGKIHSFNDNNNFGDYGPTIILEHNLKGLQLFTLYGHLSRHSLEGLETGRPVKINQCIGQLGGMDENGHWPPHLHLQLMFDMEGYSGDYPGVCRFSQKDKYQQNVPDPQLLLRFPKAVND